MLKKDPKAAFSGLMNDIKTTFLDFFNTQSPAGAKVLNSFKEFFRMYTRIVSSAIPVIMETLASAISKFADFVANPSKFIESAKQKAKAVSRGTGGILAPIAVGLADGWPVLADALDKLGKVLVEKFEKLFEEYGPKIKEYFLKYVIGAGLTGGISALFSSGGLMATASLAMKGLTAFTSIRQASQIASMSQQISALNAGLGATAPVTTTAGAGLTAMMGPIVAITAAIVALVAVYKEWSDAEAELAASRQSAQREIEQSARSFGIEGLRIRTGVGKSGKVELSQDELYEMYKQRFGDVADPIGVMLTNAERKSLQAKAAEEMRKTLQAEYDANVALAKKADKEVSDKAKNELKQIAEKKSQEDYEALMSQLGYSGGVKINIATFKEKIEEIDKIAQTVSAGSEGLQKSFETIREKLGGINFNLFGEDVSSSEKKVKEMETALKALQNFHGFIVVIGKIMEDSKSAAAAMSTFGVVTDENSVAGKLKSLAVSHKATIDEVIKAFSSNEKKPSAKRAKTVMADIKQAVSDAQATFTALTNISESIKKLGSDDMKITEKDSQKAQTNIEGMALPIKVLYTTIGSQFGDQALQNDQGLVIQPVANSIGSAKTALENIKTSYNEIADVAAGMNQQVPVAVQGMAALLRNAGEQFEEMPRVAVAAVNKSVDATLKGINDLLEKARLLEKTLEESSTIDLDAKLQMFASNFGKIGTATSGYTVKAKDVVLNVNLKVAMDATELENVMITKGNSIIRDRINLILEALPDTTESKAKRDRAEYYKINEGQTPVASS
jgi:hypothetical protein